MGSADRFRRWRVTDYDLDATLDSGQVFRFVREPGRDPGVSPLAGRPGAVPSNAWQGVIGARWVRLTSRGNALEAETAVPQKGWDWLSDYLQLDVDLAAVIATFPADPPLQHAAVACRGLRLLRQDPWECLASFILSSTKQIVQIRQIIARLCEAFGEPVVVPAGVAPAWQFPSAARLARCSEAELRACKAGFRAPYLLAAARRVAEGRLDLAGLSSRGSLGEARPELMSLTGVGRKIADCVLLFGCGFQAAFPVDVWVMRALRELYPGCRQLSPRQIREFSETHFGAHGGYAQQYLFHYRRVLLR